MTKIKLVAIDMDGTLLTSKDEISQKTSATIKEAINQGIYIVLCSGRSFEGLQDYLTELGIFGDQQYVITYNGGIVRSVAGRILEQNVLTKEDFDHLRVFSNDAHVNYNVLDESGNIYTTDNDISKYTVIQAWENSTGIRHLNSINEVPNNFIMAKGMVIGEAEDLDRVSDAFEEEFGQGYACVRSTPCFLELLNANASKGLALNKLAEDLDIRPDQVMAIGDELNDLPMLDYAGASVAMGNANKVVKEVCLYSTSDNDHDGVANALNKWVLGK